MMYMSDFGYDRECSYLADINSSSLDYLRATAETYEAMFCRTEGAEQIVPNENENLSDIESSLYPMSQSNLLPSNTGLKELYKHPCNSSDSSHDEREASCTPTQVETSDDEGNQRSDILDDIMECIQTVDTSVTAATKTDSTKGMYVS